MTVVALPTNSTRMWHAAAADLDAAVIRADHPRLTEHSSAAAHLVAAHGVPTRTWADRLAAMIVISSRRADSAPTISRRVAYLDVADAASALLVQAEAVHAVRPGSPARAVLAQIGSVEAGAMLG